MPGNKKKHPSNISHIWTNHKNKVGLPAQVCLLLSLTACIFVSCDSANFIRPKLLTTPELFGTKQFAVVTQNYTKAYAETKKDSAIIALFRGGDVVQIAGRSPAQERFGAVLDYWYELQVGDRTAWVHGGVISQYALEMQAKTASQIIHDQFFPTIVPQAPNRK